MTEPAHDDIDLDDLAAQLAAKLENIEAEIEEQDRLRKSANGRIRHLRGEHKRAEKLLKAVTPKAPAE